MCGIAGIVTYDGNAPGSNAPTAPAYPGAPAQIPHSVDGLLPITLQANACLGCHDQPTLVDPVPPGMATPMPKSHYRAKKVSGDRYVCSQCHVPQAGVEPLVGNTF